MTPLYPAIFTLSTVTFAVALVRTWVAVQAARAYLRR